LQHYFVSVPKTFVNTFVAQTEPRKDLLRKFYYEKTTQYCVIFAHEKATQNFNGTNKQRKILFPLHPSIRQLSAFECWNEVTLLLLLQKNLQITEHVVISFQEPRVRFVVH